MTVSGFEKALSSAIPTRSKNEEKPRQNTTQIIATYHAFIYPKLFLSASSMQRLPTHISDSIFVFLISPEHPVNLSSFNQLSSSGPNLDHQTRYCTFFSKDLLLYDCSHFPMITTIQNFILSYFHWLRFQHAIIWIRAIRRFVKVDSRDNRPDFLMCRQFQFICI